MPLPAPSGLASAVRFPSPGRVLNEGQEEFIPSYMNFWRTGNAAVVVPLYGQENDQAAIEGLAFFRAGRSASARIIS